MAVKMQSIFFLTILRNFTLFFEDKYHNGIDPQYFNVKREYFISFRTFNFLSLTKLRQRDYTHVIHTNDQKILISAIQNEASKLILKKYCCVTANKAGNDRMLEAHKIF